tara:strand:- start:629 stop:766 length:138 start_codon:yes stop_codon:yes gene_type:complete
LSTPTSGSLIQKAADMLAKIFDWNIPWSVAAKGEGKIIHLGTDNT